MPRGGSSADAPVEESITVTRSRSIAVSAGGIERAEGVCLSLSGAAIDRAVSDLVLETVTPASIDVAVEVFDELRAQAAEVDRAKRAQIARLREDAELAQRQCLLGRPEDD